MFMYNVPVPHTSLFKVKHFPRQRMRNVLQLKKSYNYLVSEVCFYNNLKYILMLVNLSIYL